LLSSHFPGAYNTDSKQVRNATNQIHPTLAISADRRKPTMRTALLGILGIAALVVQPANAQDDNPCRAAMSCDCPGISAGILTGGWRADCKACEAQYP
jgi:hypothetical protein